jgi:hypothetical protein
MITYNTLTGVAYTGSHPSTTTRRAAATLAAATMLLALASGCRAHERSPAAVPSGPRPSGSSAAAPDASAATPAPASASAISTRPAGAYNPATAPCRLLDTGRLVAALGPDVGDLLTPRSDNIGPAVAAHCLHRYGPLSGRSLVSLDITTVKQGTAQAYYDGLRGAQQQQTHRISVRAPTSTPIPKPAPTSRCTTATCT